MKRSIEFFNPPHSFFTHAAVMQTSLFTIDLLGAERNRSQIHRSEFTVTDSMQLMTDY